MTEKTPQFTDRRNIIVANLVEQQKLSQGAVIKDRQTGIRRAGGREWGFFDEGEQNFSMSFAGVLEGNRDLKEFFFNRFPNKVGNLVLVEIGGPGYNLANDLSGLVEHSYAVCLVDKHVPLRENQSLSSELSHRVIEGDFSNPKTYRTLALLMGRQKADILIERMAAGWKHVVKDKKILFHNLQKYYRLMQPDSIMLLELWENINQQISEILKWCDRVNSQYEGKLKCTHIPGLEDRKLRIDRLPGSPKDLPIFE